MFANQIISDIEKNSNADYFIAETALLLAAGQVDYPLIDAVRHVRGIFEVPVGTVVPDRNHPIRFKEMGPQLVRLDYPYILTGNEDITGTATGGSTTTLVDSTADKLDDEINDNDLVGRMAIITHIADSSVEYVLIFTNDTATTTATLSKPLLSAVAAGDTYVITSDFLLLEYEKYLTRVTGLSSVLDIPQGFEDIFEAGLKFKYYAQIEPHGREAKTWYDIYTIRLRELKIDLSQKTGAHPKMHARPIPRLF